MDLYYKKHNIKSKIISRSSNYNGIEIITFELEYPRYIHSEVMTHRVFSRNAQSSRAIPVEKMIERVENSTWFPIFMKNQKGMAASVPLEGEELVRAKMRWSVAKQDAIHNAYKLLEIGIHKQIVNRVLEPFSTITTLITSTEWSNFFNLRLAKDAQQEIGCLAKSMAMDMEVTRVTPLLHGDWHLPYISCLEMDMYDLTDLKKLSAARCARVSYLNHSGIFDPAKDIELHDQLVASAHLSPFEHQATPMASDKFYRNFKGWKAYRTEID
jgi:thymidylate synthase ThyX